MKKPVDFIFPPIKIGKIPYLRLVLRGVSQICFQTNELTGVLFLAAVLIASPISCAYLIVAAILAPAGRMLLGERGPVLATGLPGLNPCLISLSIPAFFHTGWDSISMWLVLVICVLCAILLVRLCVAILPFPTLALPYLIIFWILYALASKFDFLQPLEFQTSAHTAFHPMKAVLLSLGQAIFSPNIWSGMLFLIGVLLSNWRHGLIAFFGAIIGTMVSYYYHSVDAMSADLGLYGFNGVLTAVSVFIFCGGKLRLSIFGAILSTILMPVIASFGIQTLSAPFVFTTWLILALGWIEDNWFGTRPLALPSQPSLPPSTSKYDERKHLNNNNIGNQFMPSMINPIVFVNLQDQVNKLNVSDDWKPFHPGVSAYWLYKEDDSGASAVFLRYEAGARVPLHEHRGYEHLFVLEGDQFDESGSYPAGSFVIHPPGTKHSPGSVNGCVALLIYEKGVLFLDTP